MSKRKDKERTEHFIYREGQRVPRSAWDKHQRELKELAEEKRLKLLGLIKGKPNIAIAVRAGLEKARKQIMTPTELMKERRPIRG